MAKSNLKNNLNLNPNPNPNPNPSPNPNLNSDWSQPMNAVVSMSIKRICRPVNWC